MRHVSNRVIPTTPCGSLEMRMECTGIRHCAWGWGVAREGRRAIPAPSQPCRAMQLLGPSSLRSPGMTWGKGDGPEVSQQGDCAWPPPMPLTRAATTRWSKWGEGDGPEVSQQGAASPHWDDTRSSPTNAWGGDGGPKGAEARAGGRPCASHGSEVAPPAVVNATFRAVTEARSERVRGVGKKPYGFSGFMRRGAPMRRARRLIWA